MAKYKIEVLSVLLKNNKTAKRGTLVDEMYLTDVENMVKAKYISKATAADLKAEKEKNKEAEAEAVKAEKEANDKEEKGGE